MLLRLKTKWEKQAHERALFGALDSVNSFSHMRKHRPFESHPSNSCWLCRLERSIKYHEARKERHKKRETIIEELRSAEL